MVNPYKLYIDGMEIPITPSSIDNDINGQNETYKLLNGETFTALKQSKLQTYEFSFYAFSKEHPQVELYTPQEEIIAKLKELKTEKKAFEFVILRMSSDPSLRNSVCKFTTLEDYSIKEDSKYGTAIIIEVKLQEYQPLKTITFKEADTSINVDKVEVFKEEKIKEDTIPTIDVEIEVI